MKNVGVPETPLRSALSTSSATRAAYSCVAQLVGEALDVEPELAARSPSRSERTQRVLVLEQQIVHLPERALRGGRLGRLGGDLRVRMHVGERQVPPDVAHVAEVGEQLAHDGFGPAAVRALEVAVLDERDRRVVGAADVVALRIDVGGEIDDRLGGADDEPRSEARRQQRCRAEDEPREQSGAERRR